ncbi:MAG: sensor histidine kinase [Acidimicrobiales bacterium]
MESRHEHRLSASAGLMATVAVGVGTLVAGPVDGSAVHEVPAALWWAAYGLYVAAFVLDADLVGSRPRWATDRRLLAVELVAAAGAWLAAPGLGWTVVLFVVTAASAAYTLTARAALTVVVVQSGLVAAGTALDGRSASQVVLSTAVYASFQAFAVVVVSSEQRAVTASAELAAAHVELRAASVLLAASTRTAERLRISRDLHDVLGHQLTALALELEVASHHRDGEAIAHVARARTITKDLLRDVRDAVGEMRTGAGDLDAILRELVADLPGLAVELTVDERAPLDEAHTVTIVRCVQEVVTNTLRHAGANHLTISVVFDDAGVRLDARDDGRGTAQLVPGNGLTGLRERIEQLGGEVAVQTAAGHGFAVNARVPVP